MFYINVLGEVLQIVYVCGRLISSIITNLYFLKAPIIQWTYSLLVEGYHNNVADGWFCVKR